MAGSGGALQSMILNLKQGASDTDAACEQLYAALTAKGIDTLYTTSTSGPARNSPPPT
jgi:hypothetical protein